MPETTTSSSKLHIFAFGGSGARVVRSLLYLLAGGALPNEEIHINLIDLDNKVKAFSDADNLYRLYDSIKKKLSSTNPNLFKAKVYFNKGDNYFTNISNTTFKNFLSDDKTGNAEITNTNPENLKTLVESLYNINTGTNEFKELNLNLNQGFYGNPNIGAVVMNALLLNENFRTRVIPGIDTNHKVMIVGSIFGGTGAAGIPALVRMIKDIKGTIEFKIGTLMMLPYFKLESKTGATILSESWNAKTKTALSYYADSESPISQLVNAKYYLGDNKGRIFSYHAGGELQDNPAGLVEIAGAFSILHFNSFNKTENESYGYFFEDVAANQPLNLKNLFLSGGNDFNTNLKPLIRLASLFKIEKKIRSEERNFKSKDLIKDTAFFNNVNGSLWGEITALVDGYKTFMDEMKEDVNSLGGRLFDPFEFDRDISNLVKGTKITNDTYRSDDDFYGTLVKILQSNPLINNETNMNYNQHLFANLDAIAEQITNSITLTNN